MKYTIDTKKYARSIKNVYISWMKEFRFTLDNGMKVNYDMYWYMIEHKIIANPYED